MSRSIEHIVDTHAVAAERRRAGRPVWDETIHVAFFHDETLSFKRKRNMFVAAVKRSAWFKGEDELSELHQVVDEISDAEDADHFDFCINEIYDMADFDRIWITTLEAHS